jgi:membrane protease YdiL (CAAX protease family)
VLLVVAGLVPELRVPALAVVAAGAGAALWSAADSRPGRAGVAWIALLPAAVLLAVGLVPDPRVGTPGACDDLLAPPVVRRVLQAGLVLGVVAVLATRLGGASSIGVALPRDRRVTLLAAATPILVPVGLVLGPLLAGPFFGDVRLGLPSAAALVPAAILAVANAAMEESAYRGAAQRWASPALGRGGAIAAQALVFGSGHLGADVLAGGPLLWAGMVLAGLLAGLVADRTRSLLLPFAVHAAVDVPLALALTCRLA